MAADRLIRFHPGHDSFTHNERAITLVQSTIMKFNSSALNPK